MIGQDWGAPLAWHLALLAPQWVRAVVGMAVPFGGRPRQPAIDVMRQHYAECFHYILRMMMHNTSAAVPKDFLLQEKPADAGLFDGMQDPGVQ